MDLRHPRGRVCASDPDLIAALRARAVTGDFGCWIWQGAANAKGYGVKRVDGRIQAVHRLAYRAQYGELPPVLDHVCRTRLCFNPEHLEPVDHRTNILRGVAPPAANARKTECVRGHPLEGDNLAIRVRNGHETRVCLTCRRTLGRTATERYRAKRQ